MLSALTKDKSARYEPPAINVHLRETPARERHGRGQGASPCGLAQISDRYCSTMTIQPTPNRSATMPKRLAKTVLPSGMRTSPPSARALNMRSASASSLAFTESEKPSNLGLPCAQPSDAITSAPLMRKHECMILFSLPGATMPGGGGSGLSL